MHSIIYIVYNIYIYIYYNDNNNYYIYYTIIKITIMIIIIIYTILSLYIFNIPNMSGWDFFVHCFAFISLQMIPAESGTTLKTDDLVFCREHHGL